MEAACFPSRPRFVQRIASGGTALTGIPLLLIGILCLPASASAALFHLRDGSQLVASVVAEDGDQVILVVKGGKTRKLPKTDILHVEWDREVIPRLERQAQRERTRRRKKRQKAVRDIVRRYRSASEETRGSIARELDDFGDREVAPGLADALESRSRAVRELAVEKLAARKGKLAVIALVRGSLNSPDPTTRKDSHAASLIHIPNYTRGVYEYVAASPARMAERIGALEYVARIGDARSVPNVIRALEYVDAQVRVQLARLKEIEEVDVSLGSLTSAAQNVSIDLPEIELISVAVNTTIPVSSLQTIRRTAMATLQTITGEDLGREAAAWKRWWRENEKRVERDASSHSDPTGGSRGLQPGKDG